jgi:hypothetical protein
MWWIQNLLIMKIELTIEELLYIIDVIKNGQDDEGSDTYTQEEINQMFNRYKK